MKKVLIVSVLVLLLALSLVACDDNTPETPVCDHQIVIDEAVPATCVDTGLTAGAHCSVCGEILVAQETVDATGIHTPVIHEAIAPTCVETGLTEGSHCSVCDEIIVAQETVDATGIHTSVIDEAVAPTCATTGLTEGSHCSICGEILVAQETVEVLDHKYDSNCDEDCNVCFETRRISHVDVNPTDNSCDSCGADVDSITFTLSDDGTSYVISDANVFISGDITLPSTYNNKPVTSIDRAFSYCDDLTSIIIPDSVTTIGSSAFYDCTSLTSIVIPDSVTTIDDLAFGKCTSLTSVIIPDSVIVIGNRAFENCDGLTSIIVDEDNPNYKSIDGNLYSKDGKTLLKYADGTSNTIFEIPAGVTSIGDYAFAFCTSLTSIIIPDSVTTISKYVFWQCDSLTSIIIPDSVTTIDEFAFRDCDNLTSVTIGSGVTTIAYGAFDDCFSLTSIIVDKDNPNYKSIDGNLYTKDGRRLIQYAIGKLNTTFEIPAGVEIVGHDAFSDCDSLTSIVIPDSVTTISKYVFWQCDNLTSIIVDEDNPNYKSIDGNLYSKDGREFIQYAIGKLNTTFDIPAGVTTIGEDAFSICDSLTSIIIPESVTTIGSFAFRMCDSLTSIIIPDSVTTIGKNAFSNCTSLTSVTIGSGVTIIGNQAFYDCKSLTDVYFTGTEEEWDQIVIGWDNECLTNATIHYNYVPEE